MSEFDAVAVSQITELDARLLELATLHISKIAERDRSEPGSLPYIELALEITVIGRSIRHLQDMKTRWIFARATRQLLVASRRT